MNKDFIRRAMSEVLTDLSRPALVQAAKANLYAFYRQLEYSPAIKFDRRDGFCRWHSRVPYPWFNGVLSSRPATTADGTYVDETVDYFKSFGPDMITWWLEPDLKRGDWESVLAPRGFRFSADTPGMAADLAKLNEDLQGPSGLDITQVESEESLRLWSEIFVSGYGLPPGWSPLMFEFMAGLGLDMPVRNFLGNLDGRPVAASTLFCGAGVAGIYCVSTLPEARGKGIGAAVTLKPLQEAREMGYRAGVLQSSEMGYSVYKKLGFEHICQIEHFYCHLD